MAKKLKTNRRHRICRVNGCTHVLSVYNPESCCYVHQQLDIAKQVYMPVFARRKS